MSLIVSSEEIFADIRFIPILNYLIRYINNTLIIYDNIVYKKIETFVSNLKLKPAEFPEIKIGVIYNYFIDELKSNHSTLYVPSVETDTFVAANSFYNHTFHGGILLKELKSYMRELNQQQNLASLVMNHDTGEITNINILNNNSNYDTFERKPRPSHLAGPINDFHALNIIKNFVYKHIEPNKRDNVVKFCYDYYVVILKR